MAEGRQEQDWSALMAAAQAGDAAAYRQLLTALLPVLRRMLRRNRVGPDHIEDVAQDVLLTLHRVRHTYDPQRPFLAWLAAIAQRRAIDAGRRHGRVSAWETASSDVMETFADPAANKDIEAEERRNLLAQAMAGLPGKQREALELVKLRELSVAEAALASGQSEGAIKVNTHRAIRALRVLLERD